MASQLVASGRPGGQRNRVVGRATRADVPLLLRSDFVRLVGRDAMDAEALSGYAAVLFEGPPAPSVTVTHAYELGSLDFVRDDYVVSVDGRSGHLRILYRPESSHNFLFATERCSSACLMCSQPPRDVDTVDAHVELERIIDLIPCPPEHLGITGGEPTLLGDGLIRVLCKLKDKFPTTSVVMLSNGRMYCYESFARRVAAVRHPRFITSIPLYSDNAADHDYIVQTSGAFDQTVHGLYNAAKHGLSVELRVVLHRLTVPALERLAEFVYRNLPFVQQVALMGLEDMGFAKSNHDLLWIDPVDYVNHLASTVRYLHYRNVGVSVYNLPLCVLPREIWAFACQSISDHKNLFLAVCGSCRVKAHCAGFFRSGLATPSRGISPVT